MIIEKYRFLKELMEAKTIIFYFYKVFHPLKIGLIIIIERTK